MPRSTDKQHILVCAYAFHCEFIFNKRSMKTAAWNRKRKYNRRTFVWVSTPRPVSYTLMADAIATRGFAAPRETGREKERERERAPSWKRELLSAAAVRDKAESSQTPCMINDLWPRCVEAW